MRKKLDNYIVKTENILKSKKVDKDFYDEMLIAIGFFQHERLIHLIVTFFTGVAMILFLLGFLIIENIFIFILFILAVLLFVPYIFHYYYLENGVQKLQDLYFEVKKKINN